jgi:hypothetical protein
MDDNDLYIIKRTLGVLQRIGSAGMRKDDLLDQAELAAARPVTTEQRERCFQELESRRWIESHLEPILHHRRYTLTERGIAALESL